MQASILAMSMVCSLIIKNMQISGGMITTKIVPNINTPIPSNLKKHTKKPLHYIAKNPFSFLDVSHKTNRQCQS